MALTDAKFTPISAITHARVIPHKEGAFALEPQSHVVTRRRH